MRKILILVVICLFAEGALKILTDMANDKNAIIRFLGYCIALTISIGVLCVALYCFFDINVLKLAL